MAQSSPQIGGIRPTSGLFVGKAPSGEMMDDFRSKLEEAKCQLGVEFEMKDKQEETLKHLFDGRDCIAVLPTGYGKSLIFQLLPWMLSKKDSPGIVLVASPLNSLMQDQVLCLTEKGIKACFLDIEGHHGKTYTLVSGSTPKVHLSLSDVESEDEAVENEEQLQEVSVYVPKNISLDQIRKGEFFIVYGHPEALVSNRTIGSILRSKEYQERVCAVVTDEVHMVSEWGSEFRKSFSKLSDLTSVFPNAVHLAVTATATQEAIQKLSKDLDFRDPAIVTTNPDRENIFLDVRRSIPNIKKYEKLDDLVQPLAEELKNLRLHFPLTIVYHNNLMAIGHYYTFLDHYLGMEQYEPVGKAVVENRLFAQYHSQNPEQMKEHIISELRKENPTLRLVFSTVALGMGLNSPAISRIIHFQPPTNLEKYFQEIGRAGRKGQQAKALMFYNMNDIAASRKDLSKEMHDYCTTTDCLRRKLLHYFGYSDIKFRGAKEMCCGNCANADSSN